MLRVIHTLVYLLLCIPVLSVHAQAPPNILLLLADDLGYNDSGLYRALYGQPPVATMPALESLAQEGVRFSRFYTESTCSASRAALLTGQFPARNGFAPVARGISSDVLTLAEYLQGRGYVTHHVGKWHLGEVHPEAYPEAQGFDSSFGFLSQWMLQGPDAQGQPTLKAPTYRNPWLRDQKGNTRQYFGHLEDLLTAHTTGLIEQRHKNPWFIFHAFLSPHNPLQPDSRFAKNFPDTKEGKYRAVLAQLDSNLLHIFDSLKASGQWDNTIIILASDNGSQGQYGNSNAPFSGGKAGYDEGGIRAPLVIKWHKGFHFDAKNSNNGEIQKIREDVVSMMDIYPSLKSFLESEDIDTLHTSVNSSAMDGRASLLPDFPEKGNPSPRYFYSFDGLSAFNETFDRRLIREWGGEDFNRSDILQYDKKNQVSVENIPFWRKWLSSHGQEGVQIEDTLFSEFLDWRDTVRQVPVQVKKNQGSVKGVAYEVSGSNFLRTPLNPAYAIAFSFIANKTQQRQPLLFQPGILELVLERGVLTGMVHGIQVKADGIKAGQCYAVVLSGEFYDRYSHVQGGLWQSHLYLVVDGKTRDKKQGQIENFSTLNIASPTYVGFIPGKNRDAFDGKLSEPHFFSTQLLPEDKPLPSRIEKITKALCEKGSL